MDRRELRDIVISALALAIAFSISWSGGVAGLAHLTLITISAALIAVSVSFILHEMAHRFLAKRYGCYAEYRMWPQGVAIALLLSLAGVVFAAPGAVMIHPRSDLWGNRAHITERKMGLISLAGPITNLLIAGLFTIANLLVPWNSLALGGANVWELGIGINIWLALFNMLPIFILDGAKVFRWNKKVWGAVFGAILLIFIYINFIL